MERLTLRQWWTQITGPAVDAPTYTCGMPRWDAAHMDLCMADDRPPGYQPTRWGVAVQVLRNEMQALWWSRPVWALRALVCVARKRHNVRMLDSHAGPERGWEQWVCSRCGHTHTHTYY